MKNLVWIIVAMMVLGAVVPGCDDVPRYDGRLTAADSLIHDHADSALTMLEALTPTDLATEGDRAYHDLLLTQARYRVCITATSDSDINRALDYYKRHPNEREKLTRAYIYKGTVMEELGHPDSAMLYYKQAESVASSVDHFKLGYINMRMGALYRNLHTMDGKHIEKYEIALEHLKKTDDKHYQMVCMINLGSLYCLKYPEKADSLLTISLSMSESMRDTLNFIGATQNLIKLYNGKKDFIKALDASRRVLDMYGTDVLPVPFCLYTAFTYACLQMPDSAEFFLNLIGNNVIINELDKISYLEAKGQIDLALGDTSGYMTLIRESGRLSDSLQSLSSQIRIIKTEDSIDHQSHLAAELSRQFLNNWNKILFITVLILFVCMLLFIRKRIIHEKQFKQIRNALETSDLQMAEMRLSMENLSKLNIRESKIKAFLDSYMSLTRDMMEECYHQPNQIYIKKIKEVIKFQNNNKNKWEKLYSYIDMEYNDIISNTKKHYPQLNDKDLLLIALSIMDFSCIQIAIILGYSNQSSIGTIRKRLCEKMQIEGTFNDYIANFK